ncbi:MAG TPA: hypothetical protein VKH46_01810, partial [Thermoanaerobaculia bacterium]|nr:hypothetical protein [Thermoanaerobaculia bacterium]
MGPSELDDGIRKSGAINVDFLSDAFDHPSFGGVLRHRSELADDGTIFPDGGDVRCEKSFVAVDSVSPDRRFHVDDETLQVVGQIQRALVQVGSMKAAECCPVIDVREQSEANRQKDGDGRGDTDPPGEGHGR